ncbi:hypothetical protein AB0M46_07935 [Dactylosporangium sp. NPDC051485]|uniref:hypothetical protein n=1 Tax=Dactylosporangium sp. NPDC051485 TaxID=3154846 RepID=UPI00342053E2
MPTQWPSGAPPGIPQPTAAPGQWPAEAPGPAQWTPATPRHPVWIFPAVVAVVLLLAGGTIAFVLRDRWLPGAADPSTAAPAGPTATPATTSPSGGRTTTAPATPTASPTSAAPTQVPPTLPASVGSVRLDPSLDPVQAPAVAGVFDRYFAAVNARNATAALGVMDPGGSINQGDPSAVKRFTDGISTSTDDDIVLLALGPDPTGKGVLQARVTFRSRQEPGKGPKGRESEACTRWDVTYSLTQPGGGEYRIWGSTGAGSRPC